MNKDYLTRLFRGTFTNHVMINTWSDQISPCIGAIPFRTATKNFFVVERTHQSPATIKNTHKGILGNIVDK